MMSIIIYSCFSFISKNKLLKDELQQQTITICIAKTNYWKMHYRNKLLQDVLQKQTIA